MSEEATQHVEIGGHHLYCADNLLAMGGIAGGSVDLVYMDPPFNTWSPRLASARDGGVNRFDDNYGTPSEYLRWLRPRLEEAGRVLRKGGSLFLHCDWRTSHYLKVAMDDILGYENFVNEIIWKRHNSHSDGAQGSQHFGRNADSILFYGIGERTVWNPQHVPYDANYVRRVYRHRDTDGRRFALTDITGPGGQLNRNPEFEFMGVRRAWRYSRTRLLRLVSEGRLVVTRKGAVPRRKRFLDEMKGREVQTIWDDIPRLSVSERVGYPTQKPVALLQRIIACSTQPGDTVLDPFCGSGTTLVAAAGLGCVAIGIDDSQAAISIAANRVAAICRDSNLPSSLPRVLLGQ